MGRTVGNRMKTEVEKKLVSIESYVDPLRPVGSLRTQRRSVKEYERLSAGLINRLMSGRIRCTVAASLRFKRGIEN